MIEKLRRRFIQIAMIALAVAIILVTAAINLMNWMNVRQEMTDTLNLLVQNNGVISLEGTNAWSGFSSHRKNLLAQSSYFTATATSSGGIRVLNRVRAEGLTDEETDILIVQAINEGKTTGQIGDYLYHATSIAGLTSLIFLNCENALSSVRTLLLFSVIVCAAAISLSFLIVYRLSRKAIKPFLLNEQKQKQFVTDVSHELKAPLTVISANMDVMSLEAPENPWIQSTRNQVSSMRDLVESLVYLSRMDEGVLPFEAARLCMTDLVREAAEPYQAMAEFQGKSFTLTLQEDLYLEGDPVPLRRLVSILCDNAVKYTPEEGDIALRLRKDGRVILLETENLPATPLKEEQCGRLFDRFYRADAARTREEKPTGYGIGLSIAQAVVRKHNGQITATLLPTGALLLRCQFPAA